MICDGKYVSSRDESFLKPKKEKRIFYTRGNQKGVCAT